MQMYTLYILQYVCLILNNLLQSYFLFQVKNVFVFRISISFLHCHVMYIFVLSSQLHDQAGWLCLFGWWLDQKELNPIIILENVVGII